jgi:hypothetical protein
MRGIESKTCVRFVPRTNQNDYIRIISGGGCYSSLGRRGGRQDVSLQRNGCVSKGTVMHELIHALGYHHMQTNADRDRYVRINYEHIAPNMRYNFDKVNPRSFGNFGTPYDYLSIMHYGRRAFSSNGRDTITPLNSSYLNKIGTGQDLSLGDIARLRNMYQC